MHWSAFHQAATELHFALSFDSGIFGAMLALLPAPSSPHLVRPTFLEQQADVSLDLSALTSRYRCARADLLCLDQGQLDDMEHEVHEELSAWIEQPDGAAAEATALKKALHALTQLHTRRIRPRVGHGGGIPPRRAASRASFAAYGHLTNRLGAPLCSGKVY